MKKSESEMRDYFAAMAMNGILSSLTRDEFMDNEAIAVESYKIAEEMVLVRNERYSKEADGSGEGDFRCKLGKFKGKLVSQVPDDYLQSIWELNKKMYLSNPNHVKEGIREIMRFIELKNKEV